MVSYLLSATDTEQNIQVYFLHLFVSRYIRKSRDIVTVFHANAVATISTHTYPSIPQIFLLII
jgi:hypothetical protein